MTETAAPSYSAQLLLSLPGKSDSATITVTLLPDDTIPVKGQKKALADCTLRELRAFANTLEAEVWQTYDEISLLDMSSAKDVAVMVSKLDKNGKATDQLDDWVSSVVLLPVRETSSAAEKSATESKADSASTKSTPRPAKPEKAGPALAKEPVPETKSKPAASGAKAEPQKEAPDKAPEMANAKSAATEAKELEAVAEAIAFPPPVKQKDIDEVRPRETDRPSTPATIKPSEARVRVAGKRLAPGAATSAAVDILMDEPPLRAMQAHALSSLDREVAGVMVGPRPEKQPDGRYLVRIIDSISAKYTVMQGASVTYTADSWRYLNDTIEERYPNETGVMVGWYHTHPGFGIFLSGMDLFIHQNFFTQIWHTAYVLDPRARTSGFFCWSRDKSKVNKYDFGWPDWTDGSW